MKFEEIIHDVYEVLNAINDDRDIDELWLLQRINSYRAIFIADEYSITHEINPIWLQRLRKFKFKKVNASDDPVVSFSSLQVGKYTLPGIISLPDNRAIQRISGSGGTRSLDIIDFNTLVLKAELNDVEFGYGYYSQVGNDIYCWPYIPEGSAIIIAENPFEIQKVNSLYTAMEDASVSDNYPLDIAIAQKVIIEILTKDLNIKMQSIADITNDSQTELNLLKTNGSQK